MTSTARKLLALLRLAPDLPSPEQLSAWASEDEATDLQIRSLPAFPDSQVATYLEAAQRILDYEERRRATADARATAYIAAIATLVPLLTWAVGNAPPVCGSKPGCIAWAVVFDVGIVYLVAAAFWALRTLKVASYVTAGVEDLVAIREQSRSLLQELGRAALLQARANRNTINQKMDCVRVATTAFFCGLSLFAALLAAEPWMRHVLASPAVNTERDAARTLPEAHAGADSSVPANSAAGSKNLGAAPALDGASASSPISKPAASTAAGLVPNPPPARASGPKSRD